MVESIKQEEKKIRYVLRSISSKKFKHVC